LGKPVFLHIGTDRKINTTLLSPEDEAAASGRGARAERSSNMENASEAEGSFLCSSRHRGTKTDRERERERERERGMEKESE